MSNTSKAPRPAHRHTAVTKHVLCQQAGVPYEIERTVCSTCRRVLSERRVRRVAT